MLQTAYSTVVVADPDPNHHHQIASLLQQSFRCISTNTLRETFQVIQRERPVLITLELNQPDGDRLALIQYLQADHVHKQVLIACVTQRAAIADKIRAFRAGADDYVVKPPASNSFYERMLRRAGHIARTAR